MSCLTESRTSILNVLFDRVPDIYILADASKLDQKDFVHVGTLDSRHTLITTKEIPEICLETYQSLGAQVILA